MTLSFMFITTTEASLPHDPATRTLIKRHVMREVEKSRKKTRKTLQWKPPRGPPVIAPIRFENDSELRFEKKSPNLVDENDKPEPTVEPAEICLYQTPGGEQSYLLVFQYYGADFVDTGKYQSVWWDLSQLDPAAEYQISALLTSYVSFRHPLPSASQRESRSSIMIYNQAIHEINERLSDPVLCCSDGVIAAIVASILQAHLYTNRSLYALHMEGLKAIICQRPGGWESLESNPKLQLLMSCADTYCACGDDRTPHFPFPTHPFRIDTLSIARPRSKTSLSISLAWRQKLPHQRRTIQIFDDIITSLSHLDPDVKAPMWDAMTVGPMILGYIHLLCNERAKQAGRNDLDAETALLDCVHVALFLALSESRRRICLVPGNPDPLAARLHELLQRSDTDWTGLEMMKLWVLAAAVREVKGQLLENWFQVQLTKALESLPKHTRAETMRDINMMFIPNVIMPWKWLGCDSSYFL